jgi:hypothetical protein
MMDIALEAMPEVAIQDATWPYEYDNYYWSRWVDDHYQFFTSSTAFDRAHFT